MLSLTLIIIAQTNNDVMITNGNGITSPKLTNKTTDNLSIRKSEVLTKKPSQQFRSTSRRLILNKISTNNVIPVSGKEFVSTWNTSLNNSRSSARNQISLPLTTKGTYNFNVSWGDGTSDIITVWNQSQATHTYTTAGTYTIIINGTIEGWNFNNGGDVLKIIEISQWGNLNLGNSGYNFYGASNLQVTATDKLNLTDTTNLAGLFKNCYLLGNTISLSNWDVSKVVNMSEMFSGDINFNQFLNWSTAKVLDMSYMFFNCSSFDQSLSFNVSSVGNLSHMFSFDTLSPYNYDHLLAYWSVLLLQPNLTFNAGYSKYLLKASLDRQNIITKYNWTIYDFGEIGYPTPPQALIAHTSPNKVELNWSPPKYNGNTKILRFKIYRSIHNSFYNISYSYLSSVSGTVFNLTDFSVINASTYNYYITAVNIIGESKPSNIVSAQPITIETWVCTGCGGCICGGTPGFLTVTVLGSLLTIFWIRKKRRDR